MKNTTTITNTEIRVKATYNNYIKAINLGSTCDFTWRQNKTADKKYNRKRLSSLIHQNVMIEDKKKDDTHIKY